MSCTDIRVAKFRIASKLRTYHHAGFTPFRDLLQRLTFSFWPIAAVRNLVMSRSELLSVDSVDISHN